jgi:hypothetical protein
MVVGRLVHSLDRNKRERKEHKKEKKKIPPQMR